VSKPPEVSRPPPTRPVIISSPVTSIDAESSNIPLNHTSNDNNGANSFAVIEDSDDLLHHPTEKGVKSVIEAKDSDVNEIKSTESDRERKGDPHFDAAMKMEYAESTTVQINVLYMLYYLIYFCKSLGFEKLNSEVIIEWRQRDAGNSRPP